MNERLSAVSHWGILAAAAGGREWVIKCMRTL